MDWDHGHYWPQVDPASGVCHDKKRPFGLAPASSSPPSFDAGRSGRATPTAEGRRLPYYPCYDGGPMLTAFTAVPAADVACRENRRVRRRPTTACCLTCAPSSEVSGETRRVRRPRWPTDPPGEVLVCQCPQRQLPRPAMTRGETIQTPAPLPPALPSRGDRRARQASAAGSRDAIVGGARLAVSPNTPSSPPKPNPARTAGFAQPPPTGRLTSRLRRAVRAPTAARRVGVVTARRAAWPSPRSTSPRCGLQVSPPRLPNKLKVIAEEYAPDPR